MTRLDQVWAETQIEGMADGSLSPGAEARMRALMDRDPELASRVENSRELRARLRELPGVPVPRGLWWRLWLIPTANPNRQSRSSRVGVIWMPAGLIAAAAGVALTLNLFFGVQTEATDDAAIDAAVQDFTVVVAYLQKSAVMARNQVNEAVGTGMLDAIAVSRGMLNRTEMDVSEGE